MLRRIVDGVHEVSRLGRPCRTAAYGVDSSVAVRPAVQALGNLGLDQGGELVVDGLANERA
jgi:hypothetical protein